MPPSQPIELASLLRRRRIELSLSIRQLAQHSGIPSTVVFRLESGDIADPKPSQLQALARALRLDLEDLYALVGITTSEQLPELKPYLRAKYGLPEEATRQLDDHFQALRDRWTSTNQGNTNHDDHTTPGGQPS